MCKPLSSSYWLQVSLIGCAGTVLLLLASCGPKARVVGEVRDGFGKPLPDVEVSIPTTAYKDRTGSNGKYAIPFAPGKFSLTFARAAYSNYSVNQEVSVETTVPLAAITLYKHPPEKGIWLFGDNDYVAIPPGKLISAGGDRRNFAWTYQTTFRVAGDFTRVMQQKVFRFLDDSPEPLALLKVSDQGILATRAESWMGLGNTLGTRIKEDIKGVADDMMVREVSLGPGQYAYVRLDQNSGRLSGPVFPFAVQANK
ncbi:MAG: carboxypeptidase-like regulatory domain-containing protein [Polyangia bacterium]